MPDPPLIVEPQVTRKVVLACTPMEHEWLWWPPRFAGFAYFCTFLHVLAWHLLHGVRIALQSARL